MEEILGIVNSKCSQVFRIINGTVLGPTTTNHQNKFYSSVLMGQNTPTAFQITTGTRKSLNPRSGSKVMPRASMEAEMNLLQAR
jgi:hypothetical protein